MDPTSNNNTRAPYHKATTKTLERSFPVRDDSKQLKEGVSFDAKAGRSVTILGENGAAARKTKTALRSNQLKKT